MYVTQTGSQAPRLAHAFNQDGRACAGLLLWLGSLGIVVAEQVNRAFNSHVVQPRAYGFTYPRAKGTYT